MDYSSDAESDLNSLSYRKDDSDSSDSDSGTGTYDEPGSERALQLVKFTRSTDGEETLKSTVNTDVLDTVLATCGDRRIAIITMVGGTRTGKSFGASCIKEKLKSLEERNTGNLRTRAFKGFHFKHGYKPITKGIWIWSRAFIVEDDDGEVAVLLMDTEGINDELSQPDEIAAILGLSLLSSSLVVVNATGDISHLEFDWLSNFIRNGGQYQKLSFLVRDWTRVSSHRYGQKGGKKYLDTFINQNRSRCGFKTSAFQELDCFLLPHIGEKALMEGFTGQVSDVNRDCSKFLNTYLTQLLERRGVPVKRIYDNEITSQEFKTFFLDYVKYLNDPNEMEAGLKPEAVRSITKGTAGQLKIARGLEEYLKAFESRRKSASGGFLRDHTIDGMNVAARRKAIQAFRKFALSPEDEEQFEAKLDQQLKKANADMKSDNHSKKKNKLRDNLEKANSKMRKELERHFPFTSPDHKPFPEELVFYDPDALEDRIETTRQTVLTEFLKEYAGDEEDDRRDAEEALEAKLKPIEQEFITKNGKNRERAVTKAKTLTEKLLKDYTTGLQKKIKRIPNIDAMTLEVFHDEELEKVEEKFGSVPLGVETFQEQWLGNLRKQVEGEYERLQMNLESTMAKALEMLGKEESKYEQKLAGLADEMGEAELETFHKKSVKSILTEFANPFPKDNPKAEEIARKLQEKLDGAYAKIIEDGKLFQRKQAEQMENAVDMGLVVLQEDLETYFQDRFLEPDECQAILTSNQEKSLQVVVTQAESIGVDQETLKKLKSTFLTKSSKIVSRCQKNNQKMRDTAISEYDKLLTTCEADYERKLRRSVKNFVTIEELAEENEKVRKQVTDKLVKGSSAKMYP